MKNHLISVLLSTYTKRIIWVLIFFAVQTAEASCFLRHQLFKMQNSTIVEIKAFLNVEGWRLEELNQVAQSNSGSNYDKSVFKKNYGERIAIYTSKSYGNIIHLEVSNSCLQTIFVNELSQLSPKLFVRQNEIITEYRVANQILQLVEDTHNGNSKSEILIFNEELKSEETFFDQLFNSKSTNLSLNTRTSNLNSGINASNSEVYDVVETQPIPPGGMTGWNKYLSDNQNYPTQARRMGVEGTVIVVFVINTDGTIQDVEVLRGIGGGCDEEAVKIVKNAPNWEPGKKRGEPVRTRMRLPIRFKLG